MKCPVDQTEMEKGYIGNAFLGRGKRPAVTWSNRQLIAAYICPICDKVELYAERKDK